jgi:hypothetical protein
MKLSYSDNDESKAQTFTLKLKARRIELHILVRDAKTYLLVSLSGQDHNLPSKQKIQGPYHSKPSAQSAVSAIKNALIADGYECFDEHPIWAIQAQQAAREVRQETQTYSGNFAFDPKDVYFNQPEDDL